MATRSNRNRRATQKHGASRRHSANSELAFARVRDKAFDAVMGLWRRRQQEDETLQQKDLAQKIGCSPARVNKALRGPANWTLRTFAELVDAMDGEAEIAAHALEDPLSHRPNYDAYADYGEEELQAHKSEGLASNDRGLLQAAVDA